MYISPLPYVAEFPGNSLEFLEKSKKIPGKIPGVPREILVIPGKILGVPREILGIPGKILGIPGKILGVSLVFPAFFCKGSLPFLSSLGGVKSPGKEIDITKTVHPQCTLESTHT